MKKLTKKIVSIFAGIAFAVSLTFGVATLTGKTSVSADAIPTIDETLRVQMREGASIRIGDKPETGDQAIRFQTYIKKTYFDTLVNPETGVYVIPKDLLKTAELTNETPMAKKIPSQVYVGETDTHYVYNTVLYDIPENSYGRDIIARAYVKSGSNYVWAENPQTRSLAYVASAELNAGVDANGNAHTETAITYLQNYVDKALTAFEVDETSYTVMVGDTKVVSTSITPVYAEDDLSNLVVKYATDNASAATVENGVIVAKSAGIATITATLGSRTDTFTVVVNSENQDLLMTNSTRGLDVSVPTGYSVTSITCNGENWGTNPASLAISDTLVSDKTQHGEKIAKVNVSNGTDSYAISVPVTLITDTIATASDFKKVQPATAETAVYGYYILTADISGGITAGGAGRMQPTNDGDYGFRGTLDGRDHTITSNSINGGIFCALGKGAVIKDTTFTCNSIAQNQWASLLACYAIGATIQDCEFNFSGITGADTGKKGLILEMGARDCAFNNVVINITGAASTLFGGNTNKYLGFNANQGNFWDTKCTFSGCTVNLMTADSSLAMIGEGLIADEAWSSTGTVTQFIVDGCTTAAGATTETVEGITLQSPNRISVTLENQDLVMTNATHSLNLGVYANYEVQSIKFNGTDVGKDPTAITLPSTTVLDKTQHGTGKSFTVVVTSDKDIITLTIPVTLITDTISTAADFAKVQMKSGSDAVKGYYVLTADIGKTTAITSVSNSYYTANAYGNAGFMGTLDGRGYTITYSLPTSASGCLFGAIGNGAYIKDVTFEVPTAAAGYHMALFGGSVVGATFDNVEFNFQNVSTNETNGLLAGFSVANCTFINVDFYLHGTNWSNTVGTLFAYDSSSGNSNDGFNAAILKPCTFTDCNIYLAKDVELVRLGASTSAGASSTTIYVVDGCKDSSGNATSGTTVEGITLSTIDTRTVTLDYTQDIYLTAKLQMLDLGEYADYTVSSIKLGSYDFGTNPAKLTVSDAFKAAKASHGEQNVIVTAQKGADKVEITVPVIFVTDTISTMEQLLALQPTTSHQKVYGYYVLTSDIGSLNTMVYGKDAYDGATICPSCADGCGFLGGIDGRGHTISLSIPSENNTFGLFRRIDRGAIFRNLTFDCGSIGTYWGTALMGRIVKEAKFENVTFNFRSITVSNSDVGLLAEKSTYKCEFTNVDFIINGTTNASLFGGLYSEGFSGCTFTDCNVYLLNGSKLGELGHNATTGKITEYDGITVENVKERATTLSYTQDIVMAKSNSLNLGAYADYEISSITYGAYDLGTDINALAIPEDMILDFASHGEGKFITVKAQKYADVVSISVPVTLITFEISTANDFKALQITSATETIYGYYVLKNDITSASAMVASAGFTHGGGEKLDGTQGFCGTLNGNGYTITTPAGARGIFGTIGTALFKDITFNCTSINSGNWATAFLARLAVGATFDNVTFNFNNITSGPKGLLFELVCRDLTFIDVDFNITGKANNLFGVCSAYSNNADYGFNAKNTPCSFTNCTINLQNADSSLEMLGNSMKDSVLVTYQPTGVELADGEQTVAGITIRDNTTGTYLLRNNASPYTIVLPSSMTTELTYAKRELVKFFKEATGVELQVVTDGNMSHTDSGLYISLGNTKLASSAGLSVPSLKRDGAYVKTVDKTIYIVGGSDAGVINGVYALLGELFGYEQYYKDCYTLNTELKEIELDNYSITDNPDIDYRGSGGITYTFGTKDGYVVTEDDTMYSYRLGSTDAYWKHIMPVIHAADNTKVAADHNSLYYFPISMYQTSNPEFYSVNSTFDENSWGGINAQLCYTARGNSASTYDLMTTLAAQRIQASLIKYADNTQYTTVQLGMEDCYQTCTCDGCNAVVSQYGALSATVIIFLNDVAVKVNAWMASNPQYARDLQYMFFAYNEFQKPPTTYPTISDGVKIVPFVALSHMDHGKAINDTTTRDTTALGTISNNTLYGWMKTWGEFAKANDSKAWAWSYGAFMHDYFVFFDSYTFYNQFFKALTEYGYEMSIVQQHSGQRGADTAFFAMNIYLNNALAWDSSQDINTLIDNYMSAMYADAADEMKTLFEKWKSIYASKLTGLVGSYANPASKLSKSDVDALFSILDTAYAAIAHYETTDPAKYAKLKAHIDMEWLAPAKLAVTGSFAWRYKLAGKYDSIAAQFETLCKQFGIVALSEFDTIDATIEGL